MSERVVVHEFDHHVSLSVPSMEASVARRALNVHHTGQELIPLTTATVDIPEPLQKAHHSMHMTRLVPVRVRVWSDGDVEMVYEPRQPAVQ